MTIYDYELELARLRAALAERDGEFGRLKDAIRQHRGQKADDRCIEDDDRLYAALGDGVACDRHVGDKAAMLANCARFIDRRCQGGRWPSYAELEAELATLRAQNLAHAERIAAQSDALGRVAEKDALGRLEAWLTSGAWEDAEASLTAHAVYIDAFIAGRHKVVAAYATSPPRHAADDRVVVGTDGQPATLAACIDAALHHWAELYPE